MSRNTQKYSTDINSDSRSELTDNKPSVSQSLALPHFLSYNSIVQIPQNFPFGIPTDPRDLFLKADTFMQLGFIEQAFVAYSEALQKSGQTISQNQLTSIINNLTKIYSRINNKNGNMTCNDAASTSKQMCSETHKNNGKKMNKCKNASLLSCSNCHSIYINPLTLFCGHTFCQMCCDEFTHCFKCGKAYQILTKPTTLRLNLTLLKIIEKLDGSIGNLIQIKKKAVDLYKKQKHLKCIQLINKTLVIEPDDIFLMMLKVKCLATFDLQGALELNMKILNIDPENIQACFTKAELMKKIDDSGLRVHGNNNNSNSCDINMKELIESHLKCLCVCKHHELTKQALSEIIGNILNPQIDKQPSSCTTSMHENTSKTPSPASSPPIKRPNLISNIHENYTKCNETQGPKVSWDNSDFRDIDDLFSGNHEPVNLETAIRKILKIEDLECPLCFNLFLYPISTPCGHVFCMECFYRALDHNHHCPLCKFPLREYLLDRPVVLVEALQELLTWAFAEELNDRHKIYVSKIPTTQCISNGVNIPIFLCTTTFPSVSCPLHIFEPRYRLMMRRCMESSARQFGMCRTVCDSEGDAIGTILTILSVRNLPDGRMLVKTIGGKRFKIKELHKTDGYYSANIEYFKDQPLDVTNIDDIASRMEKLYSNCQKWLQSLSHQKQQCIRENFGDFPNFHQTFQCSLLYKDGTSIDSPHGAIDRNSAENRLVFLNTMLSYPFSEQLKLQQKYQGEDSILKLQRYKKEDNMQQLQATCSQNAYTTANMHTNYTSSQQQSFSEGLNQKNMEQTRSSSQETKPTPYFNKLLANETGACCCVSKNQCGPKKCLVLTPQEQSILHRQHLTMAQEATTSSHQSTTLSQNNSHNQRPLASKIDFLDDTEPQWLWWLLAVMPLDDRAKLMLLSSSSVSVRLLAVEQTLQFISQTEWR